MVESQLQKARQLIQEERYDEAYAILNGIDHPVARKWLERIERMQGDTPRERKSTAQTRTNDVAVWDVQSKGYLAVRLSSLLYGLAGYFVLTIGVLVGIITMLTRSTTLSLSGGSFETAQGEYMIAQGLSVILGSLLIGISLIAVSQILQMLLDVVTNSEKQTRILEHIAERLA